MNYLFQMESYSQGVVQWDLDYSANTLSTLDENYVVESEGFGTEPPSGRLRFTVFNTQAPNLNPISHGLEVVADQAIDFNQNDSIDADPVTLDLNRRDSLDTTSPGQILRGFDDWANIHLGYSGSINFGEGVGAGDWPTDELDTEEYENLKAMYSSISVVTAIDDEDAIVPRLYRLYQNYPNPFNQTTKISYSLPQGSDVTLRVYDLLGRQVSELASGMMPAGTHEVTLHETSLTSGIYFYRLVAGAFAETKRMIIVK